MASEPDDTEERIWEVDPEVVPPEILRELHRRLDSASPPSTEPNSGMAPSAAADPGDDKDSTVFETLERLENRVKPNERYRIQEEIARGGQGSVLRVWDEDLRRTLAMKVILPASVDKTDSRHTKSLGRFLDEAQVTGQLDHPGIVPVHELGIDPDGSVYFTMKLVRGNNLREIYKRVRAKRSGWTKVRALGVLLKVCEALSYAHDKGVIHRDLKPGNIMVGKYGEVLVMDWGLARLVGEPDSRDLRLRSHVEDRSEIQSVSEILEHADPGDDSPLVTMDGDVVGTPAYMPPEQAAGDIDAMGPHSDVYSIGALLYELISGQRPYVPPGARINNYAIWYQVQMGPPAALEAIAPRESPELIAICEKAMARDLLERYRDTAQLAEDLTAFLEGRVVQAFETGVVAEFRKWVVRNRTVAVAVATTILAVIGGLAALSYIQVERARIAEEEVEKQNRLFGLSAFRDLDMMSRKAEELWPIHPYIVDDYHAWLTAARQLIEDHEEGANQVEGDEVWLSVYEELDNAIASFADPDTGLFTGKSPQYGWGIERRLEFAEMIEQRSISGVDAQNRWAAARSAIASEPRYGGLVIEPQLGLLPIGPDPESNLWEFWHIQTGDEPFRGTDGRLQTMPSMGLVFVLLPGGSFPMGAQRLDENGPNYDKYAKPEEGPVREVTLTPFFISKYEMTQGQWGESVGDNPSSYSYEAWISTWREKGFAYDLLHPVENLSWNECMVMMERLGLTLPSEAQWEYAARAGTTTTWWSGDDAADLHDVANVSDQFSSAYMSWVTPAEWSDGYCFQARVGTYRANDFGLTEVHGNIFEWVYDGHDGLAYSKAPSVDPIVDPDLHPERGARGGDFNDTVHLARSAYRSGGSPDYRSARTGLRPARGLDQ